MRTKQRYKKAHLRPNNRVQAAQKPAPTFPSRDELAFDPAFTYVQVGVEVHHNEEDDYGFTQHELLVEALRLYRNKLRSDAQYRDTAYELDHVQQLIRQTQAATRQQLDMAAQIISQYQTR